MIQKDNRVNSLTIYIDDEIKDKLKIIAKELKSSMSSIAYEAVVKYMMEYENK